MKIITNTFVTVVACVLLANRVAHAQAVPPVQRFIFTDNQMLTNGAFGVFNQTLDEGDTQGQENSSQNSTILTNADGSISINSAASAQVSLAGGSSNPQSGSFMACSFSNRTTGTYSLTCSLAGGDPKNDIIFILGVKSGTVVQLTGSGSASNSVTLVPDTYQIIAVCKATATFPTGSCQLNLNPGNGTDTDPYKANGCGCSLDDPYAGEPIRIGTGDMYEEALDYSTAGENPLVFARHYNSLSDTNSAATTLGKYWRSTYDRYLRVSSSLMAERADGQELKFTTTNGTTWTSDSDVSVQLVASGSTLTLIDRDNTLETYTPVGNLALLSSIQSVNGYRQTLTYNGNNQLTTVTDSLGRSLTLTYQDNLLHTVTTPSGLVLTYGYNASSVTGPTNRLASVSYSTTPETGQTYLYENTNLPFALTGIMDEDGNRYCTWTYDSTGRATSSKLGPGAELTSIFYNDADGSRIVTNALGQAMLYKFTVLQNVPKVTEIDRLATPTTPAAVMKQTYDTNGYLASVSDWNTNVSAFASDYRGLPLTNSEAVGTAQARTITNTWHPTLHLPLQIAGPRMISTFLYDTNGNLLSRTDTDTSTNTLPYSTAGQTRVWTNAFGSFGHLLSATGPRTDVIATSTFTYDANGNVSTVIDPLGHVTLFTNYSGTGLPATIIDPNGVTTRLTYDARDRLLTRTVVAASGNAVNTFTYDSAGLLASLTLPDNSRLTYQYDAAHRLQSVSNSLGESIAYTLDAADNITAQINRNAGGTIAKTQSRVFDALSRLIQSTGANSQTSTYQYDPNGNRVSATDGLNHKTTRAFDALNRLVSTIDPLNNDTAYGYDPQNNIVSVTDPRALVTTYVYDGFRRVIQESSPDAGTKVYTLDKAGNRISQTDARGVVTQHTFDKLNRVITETFPASSGGNMTFTYDSTVGGNFGIGRLTSFTDETGNTTLTYNERGDVISTRRTIGGIAYTTAYGYDLADHITSVAYPSGDTVTYAHDSQGRISSVSYRPSGSGTVTVLANNIGYLPFGPMTGFTYGNALSRAQTYDQDYRLTGITTSGSVQNLAVSYDTANNLTSMTDNLNAGRDQVFGFDADYRLTSASGLYGSVHYTYDGDGNRLTKTTGNVTESYHYATTANLLLSTTQPGVTRNFAYTSAGNLSSDNRGTATNLIFNYNNRNRYASLSRGAANVATYKYNALGERLIKTVGGATTHFHYDQKGHLIAEFQANGAFIREYVWLNEMPLAQIEAGGTLYYIHPDQMNSPQKMTDVRQAIVWDREQKPFGEDASFTYPILTPTLATSSGKQFRVTVTGPSNATLTLQATTNLNLTDWNSVMTATAPFTFTDTAPTTHPARFFRALSTNAAVTQNLRFPGQYFDAESGLNYNMRRDYDPTTGRYIQTDPLGLTAISLYSYADGNPILGEDPMGLWFFFSSISWEGMKHVGPAGEVVGIYDFTQGQHEALWATGGHAGIPGLSHDSLNGVEADECGNRSFIHLQDTTVGPVGAGTYQTDSTEGSFYYVNFEIPYFGGVQLGLGDLGDFSLSDLGPAPSPAGLAPIGITIMGGTGAIRPPLP